MRLLIREAGEYIARQRETFTFADVEFKGRRIWSLMWINRPR